MGISYAPHTGRSKASNEATLLGKGPRSFGSPARGHYHNNDENDNDVYLPSPCRPRQRAGGRAQVARIKSVVPSLSLSLAITFYSGSLSGDPPDLRRFIAPDCNFGSAKIGVARSLAARRLRIRTTIGEFGLNLELVQNACFCRCSGPFK